MTQDAVNGTADLVDRAVTILERSTESLVHASDEISLLDEICRIGAEVVGYPLVWIGYAQGTPKRIVVPMARAGTATGYLGKIRVSWGDDESGQGPTGTAIKTGEPVIINDMADAATFGPWRGVAAEFGFHSMIALPIGEGDNRLGALMFYATQTNAFDAVTVRLLCGLARNLANGIAALRMKARHKQTARELAESEARYRSLVEMAPDAILVHSHGTILYANPASSDVFGAPSATALVGRPLAEMIHDTSQVAAATRIAEPSDEPYLGQYGLVRLDGQVFDAEINSCSIMFKGVPARLLTIRDVTERTRMQDQMLQTAKLATLGEMAAGLVHELSQPLNIIRLAAEGALLLVERGKATPEWQAQQFQLVAEQSERAAEIIDDIRIFSRRDSTPLQLFDAMESVNAAQDVLIGQLKPDGIVLDIRAPRGPSPVRGRKVQLEQVIMNLLNNAHHALRDMRTAMPRTWNGHIRIAARHVGGELEILVSDNGPGIPDDIRPRIFEPFFTTKDPGRGTGLGLSVSYSLIRSMGGNLRVLDVPAGTSFAITLPLATEAPEATRQAVADDAPPQGVAPSDAHILVVDDEQAAAQTLCHYLQSLGCRVSVAGAGDQAWELFRRDPADVVITDLRMPAGNGEELIEKLRDFDPLLPIIIVTGHLGATERLADSLRDDRCEVMKKPVALAHLGNVTMKFLHPPAE